MLCSPGSSAKFLSPPWLLGQQFLLSTYFNPLWQRASVPLSNVTALLLAVPPPRCSLAWKSLKAPKFRGIKRGWGFLVPCRVFGGIKHPARDIFGYGVGQSQVKHGVIGGWRVPAPAEASEEWSRWVPGPTGMLEGMNWGRSLVQWGAFGGWSERSLVQLGCLQDGASLCRSPLSSHFPFHQEGMHRAHTVNPATSSFGLPVCAGAGSGIASPVPGRETLLQKPPCTAQHPSF